MVTFKEFLKENRKQSRKDRFVWNKNDVTITHAEEPVLKKTEVKGSRADRFTWKKDDYDVYRDKDHLEEKTKVPIETYEHDTKHKDQERINKEYSDHSKNLEDKHIDSIGRYKDQLYTDLNHKLRQGKRTEQPSYSDEDIERHKKNLDHVTGNHKTTEDMHVYRIMHGIPIEHKRKGSILHDKAYVSTTINHKLYTNYKAPENPRIMAKIHVPKGTKGYYLDNDFHEHIYKMEKEFLLHRGTHFKVTGKSYDPKSNTHYVHMTVHKQDN